MFSGAQVSLYPMSDDFVGVIMGALSALDPHRDRLRIETDDISTLIVGPPDVLFDAMRDLFVAAAKTGTHCVLSATVSRGCPGEPDDPICTPIEGRAPDTPIEQRVTASVEAVKNAPIVGQSVVCQVSLYPLGAGQHMDEIEGCIAFLKASSVFDRPKNFCTKLSGDAGAVFAALGEAFTRFGSLDGHLTLDVTVSANSPTRV